MRTCFIRFLKEEGVLTNKKIKERKIITKICDTLVPFDDFSWSKTREGYNFWYTLTLKWGIEILKHFNGYECEFEDYFTNNVELGRDLWYILDEYCIDELNKEGAEIRKKMRDLYDSTFY